MTFLIIWIILQEKEAALEEEIERLRKELLIQQEKQQETMAQRINEMRNNKESQACLVMWNVYAE